MELKSTNKLNPLHINRQMELKLTDKLNPLHINLPHQLVSNQLVSGREH
jgi:hypothetical protein